MGNQEDHPLLAAQVDSLRQDWQELREILRSPKFPKEYSAAVYGRFLMAISLLMNDLEQVEAAIGRRDFIGAWRELNNLHTRSKRLMATAQELLGGVAIRTNALEGGVLKKAEQVLQELMEQTGFSWLGVVIIYQEEAGDDLPEELMVQPSVRDKIFKVPVPYWDVWNLPLIAHEFGYLFAKSQELVSWADLTEAQARSVRHIFQAPEPGETEPEALLPEVRKLRQALDFASNPEEFRQTYQPFLERLALRQKLHLWHLGGDALATYFLGPAYVHALFFRKLNPCNALLEGEQASEAGNSRSLYLPADAKRAAVCLQVLSAMNHRDQRNALEEGPYTADLKLLQLVWEDALEAGGQLAAYRHLEKVMAPLSSDLYRGLENSFRMGQESSLRWQRALDLAGAIREGADHPLEPDLWTLMNAAWECRAWYPDRIKEFSRDAGALLSRPYAPRGLGKLPEGGGGGIRLLKSRFYDLEENLQTLAGVIATEKIPARDRGPVSGRMKRLISQQAFLLKGLKKLLELGSPLPASLREVIEASRSPELETLKQEVLDFLSGVLVRQEGLDEGICDLAEGLLSEYAALTGVFWASRVILGKNPLFSKAADIMHLRFPDRDIWNLPLMAHEFGHIIAMQEPAFQEFSGPALLALTQGHPKANHWNEDDKKAYVKNRTGCLHEFWADGFALFCQGPAYACNVMVLHFNALEAYEPRGNHPSHAERVEALLTILKMMNEQDKAANFDPGPFQGILAHLEKWWSQALGEAGAQPDEDFQFHRLKAVEWAEDIYSLLDRYYGFGVRYQGKNWQGAMEKGQNPLNDGFDLAGESLRDLLTLAWVCRLFYPERCKDISRIIRPALEVKTTQAVS